MLESEAVSIKDKSEQKMTGEVDSLMIDCRYSEGGKGSWNGWSQ